MKHLAEDSLARMFESRDDDDFIVFSPKDNEYPSLQFSKTFRDGKIELMCDFSITEWSEKYEQEFERYIQDLDYEFEVHSSDDFKNYNIYFGEDLKKAAQFFQDVWTLIFRLPVDMEINNIGNDTSGMTKALYSRYKNTMRFLFIFPVVFIVLVFVVLNKLGMLG